ncbi:hypothetical protein CLU79DRAFT_701402 [Phycomyces nitens]|nr:hypothetical protein CLU79DRAFT_701402 [Phycomyces nitens]
MPFITIAASLRTAKYSAFTSFRSSPLFPRSPIAQQIRRMKAYIQVVGQSSPEGPPTIIVHYDQQRYMFNCREGTQRLCFIYRTANQVETHEINSSLDTFSDGNLSVKPVPIMPNDSQDVMEMASEAVAGQKRCWEEVGADPPSYLSKERWLTEDGSWVTDLQMETFTEVEKQGYRKYVLSKMFSNVGYPEAPGYIIEAPCTPRSEHPLDGKKALKKAIVRRDMGHLHYGLPSTTPSQMVISYICQGPTVQGKFNPKAAIKLGVKPGPAFGQLQKGIDIVLENGTVVTKSQVCEPEKEGHIFMIIDCPDVSYIENLIGSPEWSAYKTNGGTRTPDVLVHLLGPNVLEDARYRAWMNSFGAKEHIVSSQKICPQGVLYKSHALSQLKLAQLDPEVFPIPKYTNIPEQSLEEFSDLPPRCVPLANMIVCNLEPRTGTDPKAPKPFVFDHHNKEQPKIKDFFDDHVCQEAISHAKQEAANVDLGEDFPGDDVEVITLGTGSAIPSKYRNVSATLVKIPDYGSLLLDAGEGTFGQMMRRFGQDKLAEELSAIRAIFVSHLHADHHLGVVQLLTQWYRQNQHSSDKLVVVAPTTYERWLQEYSEIESFGLQQNYEELQNGLGLLVIRPVEVFHCRYAYGLSVEHASGWKLVYSGDTRPCNRLVQAGKDCTLLIHEASFEDSMKAEAEAKRHSTTGEAVNIGKSQRYPKLPLLEGSHPDVFFSFDMMSVPIKQIARLPKYTDAIQLFFKEVEKEEKEDLAG